LLTEKAARDAYDRLASTKFDEHKCDTVVPPVQEQHGYPRFAERARALILRGFLPKTAVEVALNELEFEFRNDPKAMAEAQRNAEEFLQKLRKGLI
jgi:hypothetical protein